MTEKVNLLPRKAKMKLQWSYNVNEMYIWKHREYISNVMTMCMFGLKFAKSTQFLLSLNWVTIQNF